MYAQPDFCSVKTLPTEKNVKKKSRNVDQFGFVPQVIIIYEDLGKQELYSDASL